MLIRTMTAALAAVLAVTIMADSAMADHRKKLRRVPPYESYYQGPEIVRGIPGFRLLFGDYAMTREEYDALYGTGDNFDESYYDPEPVSPTRKAKPVTKKAAAPAKAPAAASAAKTSKLPAATAGEQKTASAPSGGALTCEKATSIVSGYGFDSVKAQTCTGKTYAFAATRGGKNFAVKLDSASGELTDVKKLQ